MSPFDLSPLEKRDVQWKLDYCHLGNNGNSSSFAAQRTFDLLVGPQSTVTFTPTVNVTSIVTPSTTLPTTITETEPTTLSAVTITEPSATASNIVTITPEKVTTTVTTTSTRTVTSRKYTFPIITVTKTATCSVPHQTCHQGSIPQPALSPLAQSVTSDSAVKRTAMPAPAAALITPAPRANINNRDVNVDIANALGRRAIGRLFEKKLKKAYYHYNNYNVLQHSHCNPIHHHHAGTSHCSYWSHHINYNSANTNDDQDDSNTNDQNYHNDNHVQYHHHKNHHACFGDCNLYFEGRSDCLICLKPQSIELLGHDKMRAGQFLI
ncbi:hypothetical protein DID88_001806 [Monilinia fructigena]|uniref:Uncharacterized protein n=1 Tax=Monilinia fructigena TaxID=38457 RepID=A0A395IWU4_9HELO|nr:hypothetical protein DID88_001806 [Monilinia fructigena]